jgi:hypothetical protein
MEGVMKYLEQELKHYPDHHWSQMMYLTSANFPGGGVAKPVINQDYSQQNAIFIVYHNLWWIPNPADTYVYFTDQFTNIIWTQGVANVGTNYAPIYQAQKSSKVNVNGFSSGNNIMTMSISFQYIMQGKI